MNDMDNSHTNPENEKNDQDRMKKRIQSMFGDTNPPAELGQRQVEAMRARIAELEDELAEKTKRTERPPEDTAPIQAITDDHTTDQELLQKNARRILFILIGAILVSLPLYVYILIQSGGWQILTIMVGLLIVGVLGFAGFPLIRRNRTDAAMGLMIGSACVLIPAIVGMVAGVGLVLAVTQFATIYTISQQTLRGARASRTLFLGLITSLLTFALDLLATWERLSLPFLQEIVNRIAVVLVVILIVFVATQFQNYKLRSKLVVAFSSIALVSVGALGFVTNNIVTAQFNRQIGTGFSELASRMALSTADTVIKNKIAMEGLALNKFIQDGLEEANRKGTPNISALEEIDRRWRAAGDNDPLIRRALNNDLAVELREFQSRLPQYAEIFITDTHGALVASTNRTTDYYQADETWWQVAWNDGQGEVYVSQPVFDESADVYAIDIAFPIPAHDRDEYVGILRATVNINELKNVLSALQLGETGQAVILLPDNQYLSSDIDLGPGEMDAETVAGIAAIDGSYSLFPYKGVESLVSKSPVTSFNEQDAEIIERLGWVVVVHQDISEAHLPITAATQGILLTAIGVLILIGFVAVFIGNQFASPIESLTHVAQQAAQGNLLAKAAEKSQDEIGTLSATFNRMTSQLHETLTNLEQRVTDRTHDLELASEVGRAVSESAGNLSALLFKAVETIRSRFNLYYTQIYLVNPSENSLVLRAGTGEVGEQLLRRGHRLVISSASLNGRAALEHQPVLVGNTQTSPNFLPNPLLPHTRSELSIPLIANNVVVGVLDMQSNQADAFNEANLPAYQVLAGQLAIAIQNATLFEQVEDARREVEKQAQRLTTAGWQDFLNAIDTSERIGFAYDRENVVPLTDAPGESTAPGEALSVPISVLGSPVGSIRIADDEKTWTEQEVEILQSISTQLAQHLENLRLLEQAERYRRQAEDAARLLTREGWEQYLQMKQSLFGVVYEQNQVQPINDPELNQNHAAYKYPLKVRDEMIGELATTDSVNLPEDEAKELIQQVAENLSAHIESLRLLETANYELVERARAEQELLKVRLGMDRSNDAMFITEPDGTIIYVNPAFERIYGWTPEETIGKTPRILKSGLIPAEQYEHFWRRLKSNEVVAGEIVNKTKDGRLIPIEGSNNPILDADGSLIGFLSMHRDITDRKRAEEALQNAQEQYVLAVEGSNDGLWDWNIVTNEVYFSPRWKSMVGYNEDELTNGFADFEKLLHPEDHDRVLGVVNDYLGGKLDTYDVEFRFRHKDGSYRWIRARGKALRGADGAPYRMAGSHTDITERKMAEAALAQRANQLETVSTVSTTASNVLDPDELLKDVVNLTKERFDLYHAHIYLLDENWSTLLLAAGAGEVGTQMVDTGHAIQLDVERSLVARAARERQALIVNDIRHEADFLPNPLLPETASEMAIPMVVGDKVLGVFDVQSKHINGFTDEDAQIYTTLAAQVAVALQNARLYQEQAATVVQLRELDRLKSSFLANMSHELRTPLNSILGFTEVMLEGLDGPLTSNMDNDLKLIQKNGQHLLSLINDVLDMAKIESGTMNLIVEKFNLQEIFEDVVSITAPFASEKDIDLLIAPDSDHVLEINADRTRLRQVLLNLVNNATKFTEKGTISLRAVREENNVLISVRDTGIGIPPSQLESIFYEFTQVDSSTTRKAGGTGLGLPISRRLIEMHGGRLWAESSGVNGEGAVFHIFLPIEAKVIEPETVRKN
jgi:PAS domain S-box-containing protein